jgi:hypothetical protein
MRSLDADRLILAAGTFGSTLLLLQNRSALPRLSKQLGSRFCGNNDLVGYVVASSRREGAEEHRVFDASYGPVIKSAIHAGDALDGDEGLGFYLEDAGFPAHLAWVLQLLDTPSILWQYARQRFLGRRRPDGSRQPGSTLLLSLLAHSRYSAGVLPLLGIGRDIPNGRMRLKDGRLEIDWPFWPGTWWREGSSVRDVLVEIGWDLLWLLVLISVFYVAVQTHDGGRGRLSERGFPRSGTGNGRRGGGACPSGVRPFAADAAGPVWLPNQRLCVRAQSLTFFDRIYPVRGLLYVGEHEGLHYSAGLRSTGLPELPWQELVYFTLINDGHRLLPAELGTNTERLIKPLCAEHLLQVVHHVGLVESRPRPWAQTHPLEQTVRRA